MKPIGGLKLTRVQLRLLERLFAGHSQVEVSKLHGGLSGSLVLKTNPSDKDGRPMAPTVTKIDRAEALMEEVRQTKYIAEELRVDAVRVLHGPELGVYDGQPAEEFGAFVLEMAGACWLLPEFANKLEDEMISTLKSHVVRQLHAEGEKQMDKNISVKNVSEAFQELFGAGGSLSTMALVTARRHEKKATEQDGGMLEEMLRSIVEELMKIVSTALPD